MAIYHLSVKTVSRSAGRSATAAAAYRAAELIACDREGRIHDYTRKQGVAHTEIIVPAEATWALDRAALWNAAEAAEKRVNSTVAREYEIALPGELSAAGRIELVRAFAREVCDRYGIAADFAIHAPNREGNQRNWHAHVLTTTRKAEADGLGAKTRILDDQKSGPEQVKELRGLWAELTNKALEQEQRPERVTHKSFETRLNESRAVLARAEPGSAEAIAAQRDVTRYETLFEARAPHAGPAATNMERKEKQKAEREGRAYQPVTRIGAQMERAREVKEVVVGYVMALNGYMREHYQALREKLHREAGGPDKAAEQREEKPLEAARNLVAGRTPAPPVAEPGRKETAAERREPKAAGQASLSRTDSLLEQARSILARKEERERAGVGAEQAAPAEARVPKGVAEALAAFETARARARDIEAARVAEERQKAEAEAQRKAEQERAAEQARGQRQSRSHGMER